MMASEIHCEPKACSPCEINLTSHTLRSNEVLLTWETRKTVNMVSDVFSFEIGFYLKCASYHYELPRVTVGKHQRPSSLA